ncbi:hypothetical protein FRB93_008222 [Tulasnella sp. JGI-2019a]|nr:hypothetical protein FRB93_008222 [Tulasnella sp. JGI-2019a]
MRALETGPKVPPELLSAVLQYLTFTDLQNAAVCNRLFCDEAERILYEFVILDRPGTCEAFLAALQAHGRGETRRAAVKSLRITDLGDNVRQVRRILKLSTALVALAVQGGTTGSAQVVPDSEPHPFNLRSFTSFGWIDDGAMTFLASQPSITTLNIRRLDPRNAAPLIPNILPNLTRVSLPVTLISLICQRPVNAVNTLLREPSDARLLADAILESTVPVRELSIVLYTPSISDALSELPSLPEVHTLDISVNSLDQTVRTIEFVLIYGILLKLQ